MIELRFVERGEAIHPEMKDGIQRVVRRLQFRHSVPFTAGKWTAWQDVPFVTPEEEERHERSGS